MQTVRIINPSLCCIQSVCFGPVNHWASPFCSHTHSLTHTHSQSINQCRADSCKCQTERCTSFPIRKLHTVNTHRLRVHSNCSHNFQSFGRDWKREREGGGTGGHFGKSCAYVMHKSQAGHNRRQPRVATYGTRRKYTKLPRYTDMQRRRYQDTRILRYSPADTFAQHLRLDLTRLDSPRFG